MKDYIRHLLNILIEDGHYPNMQEVMDKFNQGKYQEEIDKNVGYLVYVLENACKDCEIDVVSLKREYKIDLINDK